MRSISRRRRSNRRIRRRGSRRNSISNLNRGYSNSSSCNHCNSSNSNSSLIINSIRRELIPLRQCFSMRMRKRRLLTRLRQTIRTKGRRRECCSSAYRTALEIACSAYEARASSLDRVDSFVAR